MISAHYLPKPLKATEKSEIIDPYVKIEIAGVAADCESKRSGYVDDNGFDPYWGQTFHKSLVAPELAVLYLELRDKDIAKDQLLCCASVAVRNVRSGYRALPLFDPAGMRVPLAYVFVKIAIRVKDNAPNSPVDPRSTLYMLDASLFSGPSAVPL